MSSSPIKTKPARRAAPRVDRFASGVVATLAQRTRFADPALARQWRSIVGDALGAASRPGRLTGAAGGRSLEVHAADASIAARLKFDAERIRRRVNEYLGPGAVARIIVKTRGDLTAPKTGGLSRFRGGA